MDVFTQQLVNGLSLGAVYALIAVGYTMVYGVLRLINFAHGDVFMVGAMVALFAALGMLSPTFPLWLHLVIVGAIAAAFLILIFWKRQDLLTSLRSIAPFGILYVLSIPLLLLAAIAARHLPNTAWVVFPFVLITAMVAAAVLGFLIERCAYRPLRDQPRLTVLITAIGVSMLLEFGGQHPHVFGPTPRAFPRLIPTAGILLGANLRVDVVDVLIFCLTLVLMVVLSLIIKYTRVGMALRAVSFRFDTAALMGINTDRIISFTFCLGSALAAVAGVLWGVKYGQVDPLMGLIPGLKAFVAAVLGGIGNIAGAVVGGFLLGLTEVFVIGYLPHGSQYRDGVAFVILIVILLVKPSGLFGKNVVEKV